MWHWPETTFADKEINKMKLSVSDFDRRGSLWILVNNIKLKLLYILKG